MDYGGVSSGAVRLAYKVEQGKGNLNFADLEVGLHVFLQRGFREFGSRFTRIFDYDFLIDLFDGHDYDY